MEAPTQESVEIMSVEDLLTNMGAISMSYQSEREAMAQASEEYHKKIRRTRLYLLFGDYEKLSSATLEYAKELKSKKPLAADVEALVELECEEEYIKYKRTKFECETADSAFDMFSRQLSFHQSAMRSERDHDNMAREMDRQVNRS